MAARVFHNFDSLLNKKKFIKCARKSVTSVEDLELPLTSMLEKK